MNVRQITEHWLRANGFDGLATDGCGCGVDDLMPCDGGLDNCKPAKRFDCDGTCSCCCSSGPLDRADNCYRAVEAEAEPEDTHL